MTQDLASCEDAAVQLGSDYVDLDPQVAIDLVAANHILVNNSVLDSFGHVSVRDPRNPGQYLQLLAALRAAFQAMLKDPDFLAATKKRDQMVDPGQARRWKRSRVKRWLSQRTWSPHCGKCCKTSSASQRRSEMKMSCNRPFL